MKRLLFLLVMPIGALAQQSSFQSQVIMPKQDTIRKEIPGRPGWQDVQIVTTSGGLISQGRMKNGFKQGAWREYSANGVITSIREYLDGKLDGMSMTFTMIGQAQDDVNYREGNLDGRKLVFANTGKIKVTETYVNGVLDGNKTATYDDGKMQEEARYVMGKRDGINIWYNKNGKPSIMYTYVKGVLQGPAKEYNENGEVTREGNYLNDNEDGVWMEYTSGKLSKRVTYKDGKVVKEEEVK